ncbi:MAG: hypothetical protein JXD23_03690 [Spirochaetales bacterium]|nr:hypothetical protein [Spirochaetales bacterium]
MTLNTTNMKRYGEKLYRDLLATGRMSEDTCAESCERLLARLKRYRDKHPEERRVSSKFLSVSRRRARSDLARRRRRRRINAALEIELAKNADAPSQPRPARGRTFLFMKLEAVFASWVRRSPRAALCVRIFLLKNAWLLSARRVRLFAPLTDVKKSEFVRQVKRVKRYMEGRITGAYRKKASAARYWHALSIKTDLEAAEASGRERASLRQRKSAVLEKQRLALAALDRIKLTPPLAVLARIAGVSAERVRHALTVCDREIKSRLQG